MPVPRNLDEATNYLLSVSGFRGTNLEGEAQKQIRQSYRDTNDTFLVWAKQHTNIDPFRLEMAKGALQSVLENEVVYSRDPKAWADKELAKIDSRDPASYNPQDLENTLGHLQDIREGLKLPGMNISSDYIKNFDDRIKTFQGIKDTRTKKGEEEKGLETFTQPTPKTGTFEERAATGRTSLEEELARGRERFLGEQRGLAQEEFVRTVPAVQAGLNVRGLLFSGDLPSEIARAGGQIQGSLESQQAQLEAQDRAFFMDAAYRNQLRKAIESGQDVGSAIAQERSRQLQEQSQRFEAAGAEQQQKFREAQLQRRGDALLKAQQDEYNRQAGLEAKRSGFARGQRFGEFIGQGVGASIGTLISPGIGTAVGAELGGGAGRLTGGLASGG